MYIYKIKNIVNGKIYIGQCTKLYAESANYYGSGKLIKSAIKKYGLDNFEKIILCECDSKDELNKMEIYYITYYNSMLDGYNIACGGNGGNLGEVVNKKISNTIKQLWEDGVYEETNWSERPIYNHTAETIEKIKNSQSGELGYWYGKKLSKEHIGKIKINTNIACSRPDVRERFLEKMRSKEVREKISNSLKGNVPWNKGKSNVYTEGQLKKMSEAAKNRNITDEMENIRREKISKYFSENHPNRIQIKDIRTNIIYDSIKEFCDKTNTSWYRTKKLRKDKLLIEFINEGC
jgi:group I intron endonuclease